LLEPHDPWPAEQIERWPIERLKRYANNPRLHSEADLGKIAASIRKWGWTMPVLVDEVAAGRSEARVSEKFTCLNALINHSGRKPGLTRSARRSPPDNLHIV
jgi:hypothetical protein